MYFHILEVCASLYVNYYIIVELSYYIVYIFCVLCVYSEIKGTYWS